MRSGGGFFETVPLQSLPHAGERKADNTACLFAILPSLFSEKMMKGVENINFPEKMQVSDCANLRANEFFSI